MQAVQLKLKQASRVLGVSCKELQNLVQFGVIKPKKRKGLYSFDTGDLCTAQIALRLKETLGTPPKRLSPYVEALKARINSYLDDKPAIVVFSLMPARIDVKIPFRKLIEDLERRVSCVFLYRDLPRGRKRPGWKAEFLESLREAAQDLGDVSESEILEAVRMYRKDKQRPEITIVAEAEATTA